jgi:hypothetical protein
MKKLSWKRRWFGYEAVDGACTYEVWRFQYTYDVYRLISGKRHGRVVTKDRSMRDRNWHIAAKHAAKMQHIKDLKAGRT